MITYMHAFFVLCRFGGAEFPPLIMFKIFIHSGGQGVKYYCGKKVIKPASEVIEMLTFKMMSPLTSIKNKKIQIVPCILGFHVT